MNEQLHQQTQSRVEQKLKALETPLMAEKNLEEQTQWQQQDVTKTEKPAYGAPPQEAKKFGGTYVSKLKDEDRQKTKSDIQRMHIKNRLSGISAGFRATAGDDVDFLDILDKVDTYSQIDRNAVSEGTLGPGNAFDTEGNAYNAIIDALKKYVKKTIPNIEQGTVTEQEQEHLNKVYQLFGYFEDQKNGYLQCPPKGANVIDGTKRTIKTGMAAIDIDVKNKPLFPHEPCVNDIAQRALGDCYLLAGLASIVTQNPEKIKECIRDNQDGTVTVRFFSKTEQGKYEPVYVTVEKKVPRVLGVGDAFAGNCLWAQMIERAYVASGLHLSGDKDIATPVLKDYDLFYKTLASAWDTMDEMTKAGNRTTFPILFDKKGNLQGWQPHYEQIEGGYSGQFIETLLGEEYKRELIKPAELTKDVLTPKDKRSYSDILLSMLKEKVQEGNLPEDSAFYFFTHFLNKKPMEPDLNKRTKEDKAEVKIVTRIKVDLGEYLQAHADESADSDFAQEMNTHIDAFIQEYQQEKPELYGYEHFGEIMEFFRQRAVQEQKRYTQCKARSGNYAPSQEEIFQKIETSLSAGKFVGAGTIEFEKSDSKGKNGETGEKGMVGTHAYTILGTETREIYGKTFKFIKMRNPWGQNVRQYYSEEGNDTLQVTKEYFRNQGVFLMELSDFTSTVKELEIN